jgi:hypothetical protein
VSRVAGQCAVGAAYDLVIAEQLLETRPAVTVVGIESKNREQGLARHDLAFIAAEVEAHLHLAVQRLGIVRREARGGPEFGQRLVAADHGPGQPDAAEQEMHLGVAR